MDAVDKLPYDICEPLAFRVLVKLANVAAQDGKRSWRSKYEMADELGVSMRSIQRALKELETAGLIIRGDQRAVHHIRADRRPTVYDINMHVGEAVQTLIHGETDGETWLSTDLDGETDGETTAVAHKELRELTTSTTQSNQTGDVSPFGYCPANWRTFKHEIGGFRKCVHCHESVERIAS